VVLRNWSIRQPVEAPPRSFHHAATEKTQEILSRDAGGFDVSRAQDAKPLRERRNAGFDRLLQYVIIL
jgi:hypothetical protein